jgi:uncharacterized membrane protein
VNALASVHDGWTRALAAAAAAIVLLVQLALVMKPDLEGGTRAHLNVNASLGSAS